MKSIRKGQPNGPALHVELVDHQHQGGDDASCSRNGETDKIAVGAINVGRINERMRDYIESSETNASAKEVDES